MSLIQSARFYGHEPHDYLADLPTQPPRKVYELLPHVWRPT
ncbi:transposase domain-containing protein [Pseudomonas sp. OG7]